VQLPIIVSDPKYLLNFTLFRIYELIKIYFAEVTTLSQEFIYAQIAKNNRDGIFLKLSADAGCDNLPKSAKKAFLKKCGLCPFVSTQSILPIIIWSCIDPTGNLNLIKRIFEKL